MKHRIIALLVFATFCVAASFLAGCNTVEGLGEDIQTMGRGLSGAAD